jgi:hypothetical protein
METARSSDFQRPQTPEHANLLRTNRFQAKSELSHGLHGLSVLRGIRVSRRFAPIWESSRPRTQWQWPGARAGRFYSRQNLLSGGQPGKSQLQKAATL